MKLKLISFMALLSILTCLPAFAADPAAYLCDNSSNRNNSWATVPGDSASLAVAASICRDQGGTMHPLILAPA